MTQAAAMPIPGSTVDQIAMSTESKRKSKGKGTVSAAIMLIALSIRARLRSYTQDRAKSFSDVRSSKRRSSTVKARVS
jgi:hypothetical protein